MATFNFSITAHVGDDMMCVYSHTFISNITEFMGENPVQALTKATMAFRDWSWDDGDDKAGTNYCQYVSYDKENKNNYLLAAWVELDENGYVKL